MRLFLIRSRWTGFFLIALGLILGRSTVATAASRLIITWSDRSSNEDGFKVERKTGATGTYAQIIQVGANVTSFIDSTVTAGTTYCYRVRAFNSAGNSAYSNEDCGTAPIALFTLTVAKTGSGRVSSLAGIDCGSDCSQTYTSLAAIIILTATPASGYRFAGWSGGGCGSINICTLIINTNTTVTATFTRAGGDTTPPTAPSGFTATVASSSQINLRWTAARDNVGVANYLVERCKGAGCTNFKQIATPTGTYWNNTGFKSSAGLTYRYRIRARDAAGNLGPYSAIATATFGSTSLTSGLAVAYGFNEGGGTRVADASANRRTGTISGATWTTSGKFGKALSFDGTNDKVALPNTFDIARLPFTLEAWIRPTSFADWRAIFSKRASYAASQMRFDVGLAISSGRVYVTTNNSFVTSAYAPPLNTWTHIAVVAESTGTKLYVNGSLRQTLGAVTLGSGATAPVAIGNTGDGDDPFRGQIDDLRLYTRALSPTELRTDMNTAVTP